MKYWGLITLALYLVYLVLITIGYCAAVGVEIGELAWDSEPLWFWLWLGLMLLSQAILLFVPVSIAERRPVRHRSLLWSIIGSAGLIGLMLAIAAWSMTAAVWGEGNNPLDTWPRILTVLGLSWLIWAILFHRMLKHREPQQTIDRLTRWLLGGSILELLVAVPCHVIVRQRHYCCAPAITGVGIATGLAVMLMSFGPGIFCLFVARARRLKPPSPKAPR
ncbi:MAG TPA: hypothetical protein PLU30_12615 [Verrucomicrobiae bacterium]|nr:hypothetical protein [Verrucomicrobiae bacterium]